MGVRRVGLRMTRALGSIFPDAIASYPASPRPKGSLRFVGYPRDTGLRTPPSWRGLFFLESVLLLQPKGACKHLTEHHRLPTACVWGAVAVPDIRAANAKPRNSTLHSLHLQENPVLLAECEFGQSLDGEVISMT